MKRLIFALAALLLALPCAAQQFDYTLGGYTYAGIPDAAAVLHIKSVSYDGTNCTVTAQVYPALAAYRAGGSSVAGQWQFPCSTMESLAQMWATLQGMTGLQTADNMPISFVGAVPLAAPPTFSLPAGNYATAQSLTVTDATPGAAIYCTANGTQPTSSTPYTAPISVGGGSGQMVTCFATASGYSQSLNVTAQYTNVGPEEN